MTWAIVGYWAGADREARMESKRVKSENITVKHIELCHACENNNKIDILTLPGITAVNQFQILIKPNYSLDRFHVHNSKSKST